MVHQKQTGLFFAELVHAAFFDRKFAPDQRKCRDDAQQQAEEKALPHGFDVLGLGERHDFLIAFLFYFDLHRGVLPFHFYGRACARIVNKSSCLTILYHKIMLYAIGNRGSMEKSNLIKKTEPFAHSIVRKVRICFLVETDDPNSTPNHWKRPQERSHENGRFCS